MANWSWNSKEGSLQWASVVLGEQICVSLPGPPARETVRGPSTTVGEAGPGGASAPECGSLDMVGCAHVGVQIANMGSPAWMVSWALEL